MDEVPMTDHALDRLRELASADCFLPVDGADWVLAKNGYVEKQMRLGLAHARITPAGRARLPDQNDQSAIAECEKCGMPLRVIFAEDGTVKEVLAPCGHPRGAQ